MKKKRTMTRRQREKLAFRLVIWGGVAVLLLLTGSFTFALVRRIGWSDMLFDLSYSTAAVGDSGALCAEHNGEKVNVCYGNARRVMHFLQNGGRGKFALVKPEGEETIFLNYGDGTTMTITRIGADGAWLEYESPRERYSTPLGYMTQFSKLSILVSLEGGAEANAPWEAEIP